MQVVITTNAEAVYFAIGDTGGTQNIYLTLKYLS